MKITLLLVLLVVIWRWTCANSSPCCQENLQHPEHQCEHTEALNDLENPQRTKRNIITSLTGTVKNATTYIGKKLHIIRKRETPGHGGHSKPANETEDGKNDLSKSKRNVTISVPENRTQIISKIKRETSGIQINKNFNETQNIEKIIKRNASEQENKTHKHHRREIDISKNGSVDDTNCTRPRREVDLSNNTTSSNNETFLAKEDRKLDETIARGVNSSAKLDSGNEIKNKTSRQAQKPASNAKKSDKNKKTARVRRDTSELDPRLETNENITKLENTTTSHTQIPPKIKRNVAAKIKRAVPEVKSNKTNDNRTTREAFEKNASNKTNSDAHTHARTSELNIQSPTKLTNKRDVTKLKDDECNNNTQTDTRLTREASETKNATQELDITKLTKNPKILTRIARNVLESINDVQNLTRLRRNVSNIENTKNISRAARDDSDKTNKTVRNVRGVNTDLSESKIANENFTRVTKNVAKRLDQNSHNITIIKRGAPEKNLDEKPGNIHDLKKVSRDNATIKSENSKNTKTVLRTTRDVSKSSKKVDEDSQVLELKNDTKTNVSITRITRGDDDKNVTKSSKNVKRDAHNKTVTDKDVHNNTRVKRDISAAKKAVNKNTQNPRKIRGDGPEQEMGDSQSSYNITKAKRDIPVRLENRNSSKTLVRVPKSNYTTNKTDEINQNIFTNISMSKNATIRHANTNHNITNRDISINNGTIEFKNDKNKTNIMKIPREKNSKHARGTKKVKRDISQFQNVIPTKRDTVESKNTTEHLNNTRAERGAPESINKTTNNTNSDASESKNGTKTPKRVKRDISKLKRVAKLSYENTKSAYNTTKIEPNYVDEIAELKGIRKREVTKQRKVARNSEANVNQDKNSTKINLKKVNSTNKLENIPEKTDISLVHSKELNKSGKNNLLIDENVPKNAEMTSKNHTNVVESVTEENNDFEVRSIKIIVNESKDNEGNTDDSIETRDDFPGLADESENPSKGVDTKNEADNRLRRKSNHTTRMPRFTTSTKNNTSTLSGRKERVEIDSALKIAVPIDGNPIETKAVLSKTKRSRNANGSDTEYILVHDVPTCRRKKRSEEYDQSEQYESKLTTGNRKNITIIIQNMMASIRKKREAPTNITGKVDNATGNNTVKQAKTKREADTFNLKKEPKCCPPPSKSINSLDNEITISEKERFSKPISRNSEIPFPIGVPSLRTAPVKNTNKIDHQNKTVVKKEAVKATRPKKIGRSLLSLVESVNENDIDEPEIDGTKLSFKDFGGSTKSSLNIPKNLMDNFKPHFFVNDEEHDIRMAVDKTSKPVDKVKCACAIFFEDADSKERSPFVVENLLDGTGADRETICSRTCSESSKLYYKMKQIVLCTHVKNFHHHLQTIMPIEHSPEEDDESETIFCQVVPGEAEPPLRYIVSWLNIILLDVVVCLTGLGIVCLYLICFVTWKKRDSIPIYTSASFTVK